MESLLKSMPPLREQEEKALNGLFTAYIFRNAAGDIFNVGHIRPTKR